jgi:hypothetical protein
MATEAAMLAALTKAATRVRRPALSRAEASDLCSEYKTIRKWIQLSLPLIRRIPVIGAEIATVLEFLMKLADTICPAL